MDINALEEIIQFSMVENEKKLQATQYLDQVRVSPDRWNVGLSLFFDAKSEVARFFGLSLVRDYMSTLDPAATTESVRQCVREAMKTWLHRVLSENLPVPNYIVNNVASIVTLCIKNDYPELWPTAFSELLQIGHAYSFNGIDVVVRVLNDLEVEVIMFNEGRTKSEIAHNVVIKDTMRATNVIKDCVVFLCASAKSAVSANMKDIAERTLLCLAELIGWIDIHMTINEALPTIYALFQDRRTRTAAAVCLFEIAKKGMDPILKVQMIQSIGLLPVLVGFPVSENGAVEELRQVGLVVDMVVVELIGCWTKFEDSMVFAGKGRSGSMDKTQGGGGSRKSAPPSTSGTPRSEMSTESSPEALLEILPTVFQLLRASMLVLFAIFNHSDVSVAGSVFPSCNRLITLLKQQCANKARIEGMFTGTGAVPNINGTSVLNYVNQETYFLAMEYLNPLLSGIYRQMQYPIDFDFMGYEDSLNNSSAVINGTVDDEDNDIVEAKKEVRKLFVNCCRVHPERCLELVGAVLVALPQPISACPFPPLEAALRLVHAFSECGPSNAKYVNEGTFPSLIAAIHSTDVSNHPHPQVLLSYFEISLRYVKLIGIDTLLRVVQSLVAVLRRPATSTGGVMIRNKCAYFVAKIAEAMEGKSSQLLASVGMPLADVIVANARNPLEALTASPGPASSKFDRLTDASEQHLFETIGLMTSSTFYQVASEEPAIRQYQQTLLSNTTNFVIEQIKEVVNNRAQLTRYVELFTVYVAQKINCLSCLAKGHNFKTHAANIQTFDNATGVVVSVLELMPQIAVIRAKCVVYLHRMVSSLGPRCTLYITQALGTLIRQAELADMEETCLLLNQCVVEFQLHALPMVTRYHAEVVEKYKQLNIIFENSVSNNGTMEAPHIEGERVALQKQYLLYLQHVANNNCYPALTSPENISKLEELLETLLVCLKGGRGGRTGAPISQNAGLPLRKGAAVVLVALMKVFCLPSQTISVEAANAAGFPSVNAANLSPQLIASFQSYLLDHAVPTVISSCSDGGRSINVKDAGAQTFLVEVASILWILHHILGSQMMVSYLTELLTKLGWNATTQQTCIQQLLTPSPLGTYKETFKQFIRNCS